MKELNKGLHPQDSFIFLFLRLLSRNREGGECNSCIGNVAIYSYTEWWVYKCPLYYSVMDWMFVSPSPNWHTEILTLSVWHLEVGPLGDHKSGWGPHEWDECPSKKTDQRACFLSALHQVKLQGDDSPSANLGSRASPAPCGLSPWSRASQLL